MKKAVIIGIGIGIIIVAIAAIYGLSGTQGVDSSEKGSIGLDEEVEATIDQPEEESAPLAIKETVKQGVGVEAGTTP